ncbi:hypothetical protein V8J88_00860 [Massilia sp. W12]
MNAINTNVANEKELSAEEIAAVSGGAAQAVEVVKSPAANTAALGAMMK